MVLHRYDRAWLRSCVVAGLIVTAHLVPQIMASRRPRPAGQPLTLRTAQNPDVFTGGSAVRNSDDRATTSASGPVT